MQLVHALLGRLRQIARAVVDGVLPPRCLACGATIGEAHALCGSCWRGMTFFAPPYCVIYGYVQPLLLDEGSAFWCAATRTKQLTINLLISGQKARWTMKRIGFLSPTVAPTQTAPNAALEAFRQGLADLGLVEGRDFTIEARWGAGRDDQLAVLGAELTRERVDILAAIGGMASRAAKDATTSIPIVSAVVIDPRSDLVADLDRPDANLTGVTTFDPQEPRKKLELLKELVPGLTRIAFLGDQASPGRVLKNHEDQARELSLQPQGLRIAGASPDLQKIFDVMRREQAGALLVLSEPATTIHCLRIAEMAAKQQLPTVVPNTVSDAGGLMGYGTDLTLAVRRLAACVRKICNGANPADLPFEVFVCPELVVNLKTAREIGISIPPDLLKRADRVIR